MALIIRNTDKVVVRSTFYITIDIIVDRDGRAVDLSTAPFYFEFFDSEQFRGIENRGGDISSPYVVSYDGNLRVNNSLENGVLSFRFADYQFSKGQLCYRQKENYESSSGSSDDIITIEKLPIFLGYTGSNTMPSSRVLATATLSAYNLGGGSGEMNTIESISVNGAKLTPDAERNVNVPVPTDNTQLGNGAQYVNAAVQNLLYYYTRSEVYNKSEVAALINNITTITFKKVEVLPDVGAANIIYLLPNGSVYDEYIYIEDEWEVIGTTDVNLEDYYTKAQVDAMLSDLRTALLTEIGKKANSADVYTKQQINDLLANLPGGGGQVNVIEGITLNGVEQIPDENKIVNLKIAEGGDVTYKSQAERTVTIGIPTKPYSMRNSKTIKMLCIGNSWTYDMLYVLPKVLLAMGDTNFKIARLTISGGELHNHNNNFKDNAVCDWYLADGVDWGTEALSNTTDEIVGQDWDVITFQQVSSNSGIYSTITPVLQEMIDYVKLKCVNPNLKIGWHSVWAYSSTSGLDGFLNYNNSQMAMYDAQLNVTKQIISDYSDVSYIIPSGTLIQSARTLPMLNSVGDELTADSTHIEKNIGAYILSLGTMIGALEPLYGIDLTNITHASLTELPDLTEELFSAIMRCARIVREAPLELKNLNTEVEGAVVLSKQIAAGDGVNIDNNGIVSSTIAGKLFEDYESQAATVALTQGSVHNFSTLLSLTIASADNYAGEAMIRFSSGTPATTINYYSDLRFENEEPLCEAGKDYVIYIRNNVARLIPLAGSFVPPSNNFAISFTATYTPNEIASRYYEFLDAEGNVTTTVDTNTVAARFKEGMKGYSDGGSVDGMWKFSKLKSINSPDFGVLPNVDSMYAGANALENLTMPSTWGVATSARYFCVDCKFYELKLPNTWGSIKTINFMLRNCINLNDLVFPNDWGGVESSLNALDGCSSLNTIQMPPLPEQMRVTYSNFFRGTGFTSKAPGIEVAPGVYKSPAPGVLPEELWFEGCGLTF